MKACVNCEAEGDACFEPEKNPALKREIKLARRAMVPDNYIKRVIQFARQGYKEHRLRHLRHRLGFGGLSHRLRAELEQLGALTDDFLAAVEADADWQLTARIDGKPVKTLKARELWDKIGYAAWASADPGLQFDTTINDWHTCPAGGPHQRLEPVLGVHVPRRHGVQPRLAEPPRALRQGREALRRRGLTSTLCGCGRSSSRSRS